MRSRAATSPFCSARGARGLGQDGYGGMGEAKEEGKRRDSEEEDEEEEEDDDDDEGDEDEEE